MKENYYLDDGTYSASQIVIIMVKRYLEGKGKDIYSSLLADLNEPVESNEFRLKLKVGLRMLLPTAHHRCMHWAALPCSCAWAWLCAAEPHACFGGVLKEHCPPRR